MRYQPGAWLNQCQWPHIEFIFPTGGSEEPKCTEHIPCWVVCFALFASEGHWHQLPRPGLGGPTDDPHLHKGGIFGASPMLLFSSTLTRLAPVGDKVMIFIMKSPLCVSLCLYLFSWSCKFAFTLSSSNFHMGPPPFPVLLLQKNPAGISLLLISQPQVAHRSHSSTQWPTSIFLSMFLLFFLCCMPRITQPRLHSCLYCASSSPGHLSALSSTVNSCRFSAEHPKHIPK